MKAVYDQSGENKLFYLWSFDSMSDGCEGVDGWGCVYPDTVQWYVETSRKFIEEDGKALQGYAFMHIPLPEYIDLFNTKEVFGYNVENICCQAVNTGLYAAFKEMNNMKGVFCGHDHDNDFWGDYNGIALHYGRKTGFGGYGPRFFQKRGARILEFSISDDDF